MNHPARLLTPLFILCMPPLASAQQPAGSLEELSRKIAVADEVWVTDAAGREVRSRVVAVTPSTITIDERNGRRELHARDIVRVRKRHRDPLWNGAIVGAIAAAAYPVWLCSRSYETGETCGENVEGLAMTAVAGAAIGAWIDSAIKGRKVVFERAGAARLRLAPGLSVRSIGVNVSLTFSPAAE